MEDSYTSKGATRHQINSLAQWVRQNVGLVECGHLDVIRFVEIDLQSIFPGLYLEIKPDWEMGRVKAHLSSDAKSIVVSENIYNLANESNLAASETILHEIGHLFLHREYSYKVLNDAFGQYKSQFKDMGAANSVEWQAKYFARCMLFPYSKMVNISNRIELQVYFDLGVADANRAIAHVRSLRLSENERASTRDAKWLREKIKGLLPPNRRHHVHEQEQLNLFFVPKPQHSMSA